jgi:hypothetical protein
VIDTVLERRSNIIRDLQARWRCELHSKNKDITCWNEHDTGICYELAIPDLGYWAVEIVSNTIILLPSNILMRKQISGNATIDIKPPTLLLHNV